MNQKVMARAKCDTLVIAFMRFLVDNKLMATFTDEIDHCLADMDMAMCRHYNKMRPHMKEVTFLNAFASELSLVMEPDDLKPVIAANGNWTMVPQQLARLYAASHTGEVIFAFQSKLVVGDKFRDDMKALVAAVVASDFSEASVKSYTTQVNTKLAVFQGQGGKLEKKKTSHELFGLTLHADVCPRGEGELMLGVALREASMGPEETGLPLLPWEHWIFGESIEMEEECQVL